MSIDGPETDPMLMLQKSQLKGALPNRIAVLRARELGVMLTSIPALRALRAHFPQAEITLIGIPSAVEISRRFRYYIDEHLPLPGFPGLTEPPYASGLILDFLAAAQRRNFDLAIQMHGSGIITNPLVSLLGAARTAGFYLHGHYRPDPFLYRLYPVTESEVDKQLMLMDFLGIQCGDDQMEFPLYAEDWNEFDHFQSEWSLTPLEYICIEVPPTRLDRDFSVEAWADLAKGIQSRQIRVVLLGDESSITNARVLEKALGSDCLNLTGMVGLGVAAATISNCRAVISENGMGSVLAEALSTPCLNLLNNHRRPLSSNAGANHRNVRWANALPANALLPELDALLDANYLGPDY